MKYSIFLVPLLWGCDNFNRLEYEAPVKTIAIKVATTYCEPNGGIEWIQAQASKVKYSVLFRCKNGLHSDWQEMVEEPSKILGEQK